MKATIKAERDARKAEYDGVPEIQTAICDPHGEFPTEAFHAAQERINGLDLRLRDGETESVGFVKYNEGVADGEFKITITTE